MTVTAVFPALSTTIAFLRGFAISIIVNKLEAFMAWIYLILAGLFEIGWPVGLKMAQVSEIRWLGIVIAVAFMSISGFLLFMAQRTIPIGTAYAVWTGIGAAGTFLVGVLYYGDPASFLRYFGVALIITGVVALKLGH